MPDTKTTGETIRTVDGTEYVRLATTGANWKATLADIFAALGGGGTPSTPFDSVQFNDAGTFGGSADFTWVIDATNTTGLTIGDQSGIGSGKSYNIVSENAGYLGTMASTVGGNLFQGDVAIGNYADVGTVIGSVGDPVNDYTVIGNPMALSIIVNRTGDLSALPWEAVDFLFYPGYKHTGVSNAFIYPVDIEPTISSESTGSITDANGIYGSCTNYGSGNIGRLGGLTFGCQHWGAGTVTTQRGIFIANTIAGTVTTSVGVDSQVTVVANGVDALVGNVGELNGFRAVRPVITGVEATVTNLFGVNIQDHSGIGDTLSYNIVSRNAAYIGTMANVTGGNLFQGHVAVGNNADVHSARALVLNEKLTTGVNGSKLIRADWSLTHTPSSPDVVAGAILADVIGFIESASTGDYGGVGVLGFLFENDGVGDVSILQGIRGEVDHFGSGTVDTLSAAIMNAGAGADVNFMTGIEVICQTQGGTTSDMTGISIKNDNFGGTITNSYSIKIDPVFLTATNAYGLNIGDHTGHGSTLAYNLVSRNAGYLGTMTSKVGGNLFQGHVAIGNYADIDVFALGPGDPQSAGNVVSYSPLSVQDFMEQDFSGVNASGVQISPGFKHTGSGVTFLMSALQVDGKINSDSTGPIGTAVGCDLFYSNAGLGNVTTLEGAIFDAEHDGIGTVATMRGADIVARQNIRSPSTGDVTTMQGVRIRAIANATTTNLTGELLTVSAAGAVANAIGLDISAVTVGSTLSYNLVSRNAGYAGTMQDKTGGNLFQGHSAFGSYADVDRFTGAPGDPTNTFINSGFFTVLINDAYQGQLGGFTQRSGLGIYLGYEHTGSPDTSMNASAVQCFPHISGDSTGTVGEVRSLNFNIANFGQGAATSLLGVVGSIDHWGPADVTNATVFEGGITAGNGGGDVINARVFHANAVVKFGVGADAHNVFGLDLEDQSGIGSSLSYNLVSRNADYVATMASKTGGNLFQGHVAIGNSADVDRARTGQSFPGSLFNAKIPLIVNTYDAEDFSARSWNTTSIMSYPLFKHTGASKAYFYNMDLQPLVTTDSTGPIGDLVSVYGTVSNWGSGNVDFLIGLQYSATQAGSGSTANEMYGLKIASATFNSDVNNMYGGQFNCATYGSTDIVKNCSIVKIPSFQKSGGSHVGNLYGLEIGDQSGIGGTLSPDSGRSYNLVSRNADYLGTMASTVGGNLFQGHVAIGNYADVGFVTNSPGDPGAEFSFGTPVSLVINNFYDDPPDNGTIGIEVCDGFEYTGVGSANNTGIAVQSTINSTSTGNWLNMFGMVFSPQNSGLSGDITNMVGVQGGPINVPTAGTVTHLEGARIRVLNGGNVTNLRSIRLIAPLNFGMVSNAYGLEIEDHSGIGGMLSPDAGRSWNIWSQGVSSRNVFEGIIKLGTAINSSLEDGDVWFDGTDLKLRTGGVTKTFTVT